MFSLVPIFLRFKMSSYLQNWHPLLTLKHRVLRHRVRSDEIFTNLELWKASSAIKLTTQTNGKKNATELKYIKGSSAPKTGVSTFFVCGARGRINIKWLKFEGAYGATSPWRLFSLSKPRNENNFDHSNGNCVDNEFNNRHDKVFRMPRSHTEY